MKSSLCTFLALLCLLRPTGAAPITDTLTFGNDASEQSHHLQAQNSSVNAQGGLENSCRSLLPNTPATWDGGSMSFTMQVDPKVQNYFTARFWGSDSSPSWLILYCEGKQIGYRHIGDIDILASPNGSPPCQGRFFYHTEPLPLSLTLGKTELHFEIRSQGKVWGYGTTFEQYQKPMTDPAPGVYRVYTHTDGCFEPPTDEVQGTFPKTPPVCSSPGEEVLETLKTRLSHDVSKALTSARPLDQLQVDLLARAYHVTWTPANQNEAAVRQVIRSVDDYYHRFKQDPKLAQNDPKAYNGDWVGLGRLGDAVWEMKDALGASLDQPVDGVARRDAWSEMFQASRDWHERHRREYTNQTMIVDLNFYTCNRALEVVDPAHAQAEDQIRHYLYESIGLQPWLGSDTDQGPAKPLGDDYWELTPKALTKELGFVGYYGEVIDWVTSIYLATGEPGQPDSGDKKIRAQLLKIAQSRAYFRYPALDDDGNRAMRAEAVIGWRDMDHFPGDVLYGERVTWDASSLYLAANTLDPNQVGYAQQMFDDGQFFASVEHQLKEANNTRVDIGLLPVPDQYDLLKAQAPQAVRLPMTPGQPDFVFSDEVDGVVALKHGADILYTSLYWRARGAINFLARVHEITPALDRIAVVHEDIQFNAGPETYTRPDWTNMGFGNGGLKYPGDLHSAEAGEQLPEALPPPGVTVVPGIENPYLGRGSFYRLLYGKYLIGMNMTKDQVYNLDVPDGVTHAIDLVTQKDIPIIGPLEVPVGSTVVLYLAGSAPKQNQAAK